MHVNILSPFVCCGLIFSLGGLLSHHQRDGLLFGDGFNAPFWPSESDGGSLGAHGLRLPGEVGDPLRRPNADLPVAGGRHRPGMGTKERSNNLTYTYEV